MTRSFFLLLVGILLLLPAGCTRGPYEVVPFSGTVTWQGKPVPDLAIFFEPEVGRPSNGVTDENGRFTMIYTVKRNGVQKGKGKFYFEGNRMIGDGDSGQFAEIFKKYSRDNTPLLLDVQKPEKNYELKLE